jgi:hypothetical protein
VDWSLWSSEVSVGRHVPTETGEASLHC